MREIVGLVGLCNMGLAMATNLLKAGFGLRVYNRTAEKARPMLEKGATLASSPAEAAEPGGIVVTMVTDDRALEDITLGANGLLDRLGDGVHLSMSTIAPFNVTTAALEEKAGIANPATASAAIAVRRRRFDWNGVM